MKTILNKKNIDTTKQPLFLGEDLALQRYEKPKYESILKFYERQLELYWRPNEVNISLDAAQFKMLPDHEKHIFTKNLQFQTLMDSVISRGVPTITEYVSNPELEACLKAWEFFETLHSFSYTYIIKNIYPNPTEIMDQTLEDKEILARCDSVSQEYDRLRQCSNGDIKKQIYLTLISVNILEAIRFYVSFVCAFAFANNKKMVGNADIIKFIKRDELVHLSITQEIIRILRENEEEGFQQTIQDNKEEAVRMFKFAVDEEKEWSAYLFKDGGILGLNHEIVSKYIEWLADLRLEQLKLPKQYDVKKSPIGGWITPWMDSDSVQVAPQESEITSYKVFASKSDLSNSDFSDIEL